jgi:ring-1,2-phenylacetyl-CoA epoxidase subunit PaaA
MNYRVKRESDSLRQRFIDVTVSQAEFLGLTIPDKDLKWNEERQHYDLENFHGMNSWNLKRKRTL